MRYTLDDLETFLAVMDLGTVTAAAARLNLAKSVVSKRIAALEGALNTALFLRNAGRIAPTEAALRLAARLRPALGALTAAAESAADGVAGAGLRGRLAVAAPMSFGTMHLGPVLARFAAAHPDLEMTVDCDDRARDLAREGFDVGIRVGQARDGGLMQRKLCEDRLIACAAPGYLARHGTPDAPADLGGHQVIGYHHVPNAQVWRFRADDGAAAPDIRSRLSLNNGEAMRDMARAGLGIAMLPGFIAVPDLRAGLLVEVLRDAPPRPLPIAAVWPPVDPMPAKLRRFVDHLVAELGTAPWAAGQNSPSTSP